MMLRNVALGIALGATALLGQTPATSAPTTPAAVPSLPDAPSSSSQVQPAAVPTGPTVVLDTSMGRMTCKLFDRQAPVAAANFISLAEGTKDWTDPTTQKKMHNKRMFDGTTFHRVIPGFMIQGGDPTGTGMGDPGYYFQDEIDPALDFSVPGRLAMANSGPGPSGAGTNGSQFFITEVEVPQLNGRHTIFGQCDAHSVLIVASIARVDRDPVDKPRVPVTINKVTIVREGQPIPADPTAAPPAAASAPAATRITPGANTVGPPR